jgi:hypothetical protein
MTVFTNFPNSLSMSQSLMTALMKNSLKASPIRKVSLAGVDR